MRTLLYASWFLWLLMAREPVKEGKPATSVNVVSCSRTSPADTSINGKWFLQPVLPSDTAAGRYPEIIFHLSRKTFSGNTGCNTMNGSFQRTDTSFVFNEKIRLTKKLCTGYNEQAFLNNLLKTNRYKIEDGVLILLFDMTELSRWTRKPMKAPLIKNA